MQLGKSCKFSKKGKTVINRSQIPNDRETEIITKTLEELLSPVFHEVKVNTNEMT